jgi:hypothetical protein
MRAIQEVTTISANVPTGVQMQGQTLISIIKAANPLPVLMTRSAHFRALAKMMGEKGLPNATRDQIVQEMTKLIINEGRAMGTAKLNQAF